MVDIRLQAGPHAFVDDLEQPVLAESDRHHLERSLRLRAGDPFTISNGRGSWCTAGFGTSIDRTGDIHHEPQPPYPLGLGLALTKASKPEFAVQKATELGMDRIVIFEADHSVVRWDDSKRLKNRARLERVAREAAMQSRRTRLPDVQVVSGFEAVLAGESAGGDDVVRADFGGVAIGPEHRFVVVGPEGGWSSNEQDRVPIAVDLGRHVLRAETAAVAAATLLAAVRSLHHQPRD